MYNTCNLPDMQFTHMNMQYPAKKLTPYPGDAYVTLKISTDCMQLTYLANSETVGDYEKPTSPLVFSHQTMHNDVIFTKSPTDVI